MEHVTQGIACSSVHMVCSDESSSVPTVRALVCSLVVVVRCFFSALSSSLDAGDESERELSSSESALASKREEPDSDELEYGEAGEDATCRWLLLLL